MSVHTSSTSTTTRHVGTVGDKRVVVIIQDPQATNEVHIVDTDALPDLYHQNLMDMLMTPQAQASKWFGEYMHRNMLFDGTNALRTFYEKGWITQVPVTSVILTPRPNVRVPLTDELGIHIGQDAPSQQNVHQNLNENRVPPADDPLASTQNPVGIQEQNFADIVAQEQAKLDQFDPSSSLHNQHQANLDGDVSEQNKLVASNLIAEAELLEADAKAKRELAATYDPSTKRVTVSESNETDGGFVDEVTGKSYKTEAALKAAVTRRENAANETGNG